MGYIHPAAAVFFAEPPLPSKRHRFGSFLVLSYLPSDT